VRVQVICRHSASLLALSTHSAENHARLRLYSRVKVEPQPGMVHSNGASCFLRPWLASMVAKDPTGLSVDSWS
jgi:hypothetical protein